MSNLPSSLQGGVGGGVGRIKTLAKVSQDLPLSTPFPTDHPTPTAKGPEQPISSILQDLAGSYLQQSAGKVLRSHGAQ